MSQLSFMGFQNVSPAKTGKQKRLALCASGRRSSLSLCELLIEDGKAPEWIMLVPAGDKIEALDGRTFSNPNPQKVVDKFRDTGIDLPIDINHAEEKKAPKGEEAESFGWINDMEVRDGAIWGHVEWTEDGATKVASKAYRYISPAFFHDKSGAVVEISSAALVNKPALLMPALAHNQGADTVEHLKAILALLGMDENSPVETALAGIKELQKQCNKLMSDLAYSRTEVEKAKAEVATARGLPPSLDKFVPRPDFDKAVARAEAAEKQIADQAAAALARDIETEIDAALKAGKIAPASKEYYLASCKQQDGLKLFRDFVKTAPVIAADSNLDEKLAPTGGSKNLTDTEKAVARTVGVTEEQFLAAKAS